MSLSPEKGNPNHLVGGHTAAQYVYQPASAASSQQIIEESLKASSSDSFTSVRPSPTPSTKHRHGATRSTNPENVTRRSSEGKMGSYKQALADAEGEEGFRPSLSVRQRSWNEQDLKRAMQWEALGEEKTAGFSKEGENR